MTLRSIFLFAPAETASADRGPAAYAIQLAVECGAHLTVFCVALDVNRPGGPADADQVANTIVQAAASSGVTCHAITNHSHAIAVHEAIAEHVRTHDLCVAGVDNAGLLSEHLVTEYLLFHGGRPIIVVPDDFTKRPLKGPIVVAWDNSGPAARSMGDAFNLLQVLDIRLVSVGDDKALQTSLSPKELLEPAHRRGIRAEWASIGADNRTVADTLQRYAETQNATLLVMGARVHSRLHRAILGSATTDLLQNIRIPTLLSG